jgi:hypothetical protein
MSVLQKLKDHWIVVLVAAIASTFVVVGQFSDALKKTGMLCKTPVDAVLDCLDNTRACEFTAEVCAVLRKRYGEIDMCNRGCSSRP